MFARALSARAGLTAASSRAAAAASAAACRRPCVATRNMSPLRARVMLPGQAARPLSQLSSSDPLWRPVEGDEPEDVVFSSIYGLRTIELNRPKKLNPLNASMIRKIAPRLIEWSKSDMANVIVMKGAGNALCAGGDVAALALDNQTGEEGVKRSEAYFALEYKLNHLIATLQKPYIAFMDGWTMGGGVGLSIHAPFRIATERTVFAMPETNIGFFPDVGASFFLPRLPGALGRYLALTSEHLQGPNVLYAGVATHYMHSTTLPMLEGRLAELRFRDFDTLEQRLHMINDTIEEYATGLPHDQPMVLGGELRTAIDRCFSKDTIFDVLSSLHDERQRGGPMAEWADKTLATLHARSPTSVHVTFAQLRESAKYKWTIAETFKREHHVASQFMRHHDFFEGVDAQLIRKDKKPQWQPASLEDIINLDQHEEIRRKFIEMPDSEPLQLLTDADFSEYPYRKFGLPTEEEVRQVVSAKRYTAAQVVNFFVAQRLGKQGVREVVSDIVERRTEVIKGMHPPAVRWLKKNKAPTIVSLAQSAQSAQSAPNEEVTSTEEETEAGSEEEKTPTLTQTPPDGPTAGEK